LLRNRFSRRDRDEEAGFCTCCVQGRRHHARCCPFFGVGRDVLHQPGVSSASHTAGSLLMYLFTPGPNRVAQPSVTVLIIRRRTSSIPYTWSACGQSCAPLHTSLVPPTEACYRTRKMS
jgi:hypothetical protein